MFRGVSESHKVGLVLIQTGRIRSTHLLNVVGRMTILLCNYILRKVLQKGAHMEGALMEDGLPTLDLENSYTSLDSC